MVLMSVKCPFLKKKYMLLCSKYFYHFLYVTLAENFCN